MLVILRVVYTKGAKEFGEIAIGVIVGYMLSCLD